MRDTISWPPRDPSRRGSPFMGIVALALLITVVTFTYSAARGRSAPERPLVVPAPPTAKAKAVPRAPPGEQGGLRAISMNADTELRLLIADPPSLLDLDEGRTSPLPGLADGGRGVYDVLSVGDETVLVSKRACLDCLPDGEAFVLRSGTAVSLGPAWSVASSLDGQGVWVLRYVDERRCMLREVGLNGELRRADRPIDCRARLRKETPAGLLVDIAAQRYGPPDSALLDPATGGAIGRYPRIGAITRQFTLTRIGERGSARAPAHPWAADDTARGGQAAWPGRFVLTDLRSGARHPLPWPSELEREGESAAGPRGRFLAVEFADPAAPGARQLMDVWVLDTVARRWQQLPGMPAPAVLGHTSMAWTPDGRLVILGTFDGIGDAVVVWRPGDDRIAVRRVELPDDRSSGSFAVLPSASSAR